MSVLSYYRTRPTPQGGLAARVMRDPSGSLPHHYQTCRDCGGAGTMPDPYEDDGETCDCETCDGDGGGYWGSWYAEDKAQCDECDAEDVHICGRLLESAGPVPEHYVCLPCYVRIHARAKCCDAWRPVERLLGVSA